MSKPMQRVLITGASSGIGLELARLMAADGSNLVLVARSEGRLNELADELRSSAGIQADVVVSDLTDPSAPEALFQHCEEQGWKLDGLVNNAGYGGFGMFAEMDRKFQLDMIQLNVTSLTHLTHLFLPGMLERGRGRVMNVASTASFQPGPTMATYYATKAFVLSFSEAISNEVEGTGVTVTALCPGPTKSGFQEAANLEGSRVLKFGLMTSESVAASGYKAMLAGTPVLIPGIQNWTLAQSIRFTPRFVVRKIIRTVQAKD